jgi:hypothetical protein
VHPTQSYGLFHNIIRSGTVEIFKVTPAGAKEEGKRLTKKGPEEVSVGLAAQPPEAEARQGNRDSMETLDAPLIEFEESNKILMMNWFKHRVESPLLPQVDGPLNGKVTEGEIPSREGFVRAESQLTPVP